MRLCALHVSLFWKRVLEVQTIGAMADIIGEMKSKNTTEVYSSRKLATRHEISTDERGQMYTKHGGYRP